jgi:hypothetical protein
VVDPVVMPDVSVEPGNQRTGSRTSRVENRMVADRRGANVTWATKWASEAGGADQEEGVKSLLVPRRLRSESVRATGE